MNIVVVAGGPSAEADVSRRSGRAVADALRLQFSNVILAELDADIATTLAHARADVVFPALHGSYGEDGRFQGFLDVLGIPYVGSGVAASACAMDKPRAKALFRAAGLAVAPDLVVPHASGAASGARAVLAALGADVVIKPAAQGSALGVAFARTPEALEPALADSFVYGEAVLVERRVAGREVTVGVLEDAGVQALPPIEIRTPPDAWYDYDHRYTKGLSEHVVPAEIPAAQLTRVQAMAVAAHVALGCRDLSRADFIVPDAGEPVLLEVNTLPGMTETSLYPDAARAAGWSFPALVAHLVERAFARAGRALRKPGPGLLA